MDKLDELRLRYLNSLPQKGRDLLAQWQRLLAAPERALLVELHQHAHRLSGSAPAYGFDAIGALARPLDLRIAEWLRADADERESLPQLLGQLAAPVAALAQALGDAAAPP
jgi:HPt (histidine-containing phosphotransfer) domain-containing protein